LGDAQLAGIGYWLSGIGLVILHTAFYILPQGDMSKMKPIPQNHYPVPDTQPGQAGIEN